MENNSFNSQYGLCNLLPLCSNGQIAKTICFAPKCQKQSLLCQNDECTCQQIHNLCLTMHLPSLLKNIKQKKQKGNKYFRPIQQSVQKIFQNLIDKLSDIRQNIIKEIENSWLSDKQKKLIECLEFKRFECITGKNIVNEVCTNLYNSIQRPKKQQIMSNIEKYESQLLKEINSWSKTLQIIIFQGKNQLNQNNKNHVFDINHPFNTYFNLSKNNQKAIKNKNGKEICIYSQSQIFLNQKSVDQFSIRCLKSTNQWIIYGLATQELKFNNSIKSEDILHHKDFIGYNLHQGGCVYQKGKGYVAKNIKFQQKLNSDTANNDDFSLTIKISKIQRKIFWIKNKKIILAQAKITKEYLQKKLYPCIFLFWSGDTVQFFPQDYQFEQ